MIVLPPLLKRTCFILAALGMALPQASAEIRIGAILSVTGAASFLGEPEKKTLEMRATEINLMGGIDGEKIALIIYDDASDASRAVAQATRLVEEDKIVAVIGGSTTGSTLAMMPVFEDAEIPVISVAAGSEIVEPVHKWVFKMPHTDTMACVKILEDMRKRKLMRIALILSNDGFGGSMRDKCFNLAVAAGMEIMVEQVYSIRATDVSEQLTAIKNTPGVQAVLNATAGKSATLVTQTFRQLGLPMPLYESHGVASKQYIENAGAASEGVRLPTAALTIADKLPDGHPQKGIVNAYKAAFEAKTGQRVSTFGGHAFDALNLLTDALRRAKSVEPDKIRDEIEKSKGFVSTGGVLNISPTDHVGLNADSLFMVEIKNGDWTLVPD